MWGGAAEGLRDGGAARARWRAARPAAQLRARTVGRHGARRVAVKVHYRRMRNIAEQHLGNATSSITLSHQLRDLWKSPRGTVLRIEALALVAIALSFLVAAFGSCRRWSNRWIVQKGFLAANVLSISLGTYSIGLMQSSSVKSEMYPIWAVSLFTLLPCVDIVTSYVGLDYKSPLSKMVFQICLYFGYVLLMSTSTTSTDIGNKAIYILCAITFIRGFHRSLALVLPSRLRDRIETLDYRYDFGKHYLGTQFLSETDSATEWKPSSEAEAGELWVHISHDSNGEVRIVDIRYWCQQKDSPLWCQKRENDDDDDDELSFEDVCMAYSLSHLLQGHFVGLSRTRGNINRLQNETVDCKRALRLVEVELAFLFETFFTSNAFLHYYQAKAASLWTLASFVVICFVGVTVAIPGTTTGRSATPRAAGTSIVVDTTTADLVITLVILVSLALLQLVLMIRCWMSNWARVAIACQYVRNKKKVVNNKRIRWWMRRPMWWMRLKVSIVTMGINWSDKYLWQDKLDQHSIVEENRKREWKLFRLCLVPQLSPTWHIDNRAFSHKHASQCDNSTDTVTDVYSICASFLGMFGFQYIGQVVQELWASSSKVGASVRLHADVKASIVECLSQIQSGRIEEWLSLFFTSGIPSRYHLSYVDKSTGGRAEIICLLEWHIATWYCELVEREQDAGTGNAVATACFKKVAGCFSKQNADAAGGRETDKYRRVAIALSKYYAYLVKSAPELLPGTSTETKSLYREVAREVEEIDWSDRAITSEEIREQVLSRRLPYLSGGIELGALLLGKQTEYGMCYSGDRWELLARFWAQALVYVAPYGNIESHMRHLSEGGEFITHLWALLYHLGISKWELNQDGYEKFRKDRHG